MLGDLVKNRVDSKKPRVEGLTFIIDKFQSLDKESFELLSPFIDTVKIYGALPLLVPEMVLKKRIKFYHDFDVHVSTGSTIAEFAILENSITPLAKKAAEVGFDTLELGENNVDLLPEDKRKVVDVITSQDLDLLWKVGKKDPRHQLSIEETINKNRSGCGIRIKKSSARGKRRIGGRNL